MLSNSNNNSNNISINNNSDNNINNKQIIVQKKSPLKKIGNYLLSHTIGEGAFAKVKLATHIYTGEKVAIKILSKSQISQQEYPKFLNEISILKSLKHKNIINLYEIIDTPHKLYIIMEYCPNNSLFDYISKRKHLTEREACRLFQQIINAVEYLHLNKISHRDLKPENILLSSNKRIKIIDFGLSKKTLYFNSLLKTPCGTPSYAPPEMLRGENYNGILSDIYSIGIILYTMIVGNLPCLNNFNEEIIYNIMINKSYKYPSYISLDCIDLIEKMINVNSNERILFKEIKQHKWFNLIESKMRVGILHEIIKIPVDEEILKKIEDYGYNSEDIKKSVIENKYDNLASLYYLELHSWMKEGRKSCSDLYSEEYIKWIKDIKNWEQPEKIYEEPFYEYKNIIEENNNNQNINNDYFNIENYIKKNKDFDNFDNLKKYNDDNYNYYNLNDTSINNSINFISNEHSRSNSINNDLFINNENNNNLNNNSNKKTIKNNIIKKKKNKRKSAFGENLKLQLEPLLKQKKRNSSHKKIFYTKTDNNNNNNTFSFKYKNLLNNNNINTFNIKNKNFISFLSPIKNEKKEKLNKKLLKSKENFNNFLNSINNTNNSNNNFLNIISKKLINTTIFSKYIKNKQNNKTYNKNSNDDILLNNVYRLEKYKNLFNNIKSKHLGIFPKKLYNFNINTIEEVLNIEDDDLVFTNNFYNYNNINENFIKNLKNNIKNKKYNNNLLKRKMTYNNILTKKISCLEINNDINIINNSNKNKIKKKFIINSNKTFSKRNSLDYKINKNKNNNLKFNIDDEENINNMNIFNNYNYSSENISSEDENNFINKTLTNINDNKINLINKMKIIKNKNNNNKIKDNKKIIKKKPNLKIYNNHNNKILNNAIHNNLNQFSIIKNELNNNITNIKKTNTNRFKKKIFIKYNKNFTNNNSIIIENNNSNNHINNNNSNSNINNNSNNNINNNSNNHINNNNSNNNINNNNNNSNNHINNNNSNNHINNNSNNNNNNNNEQIPKILDLNCFIFLSYFDILKKIKSFFKSNEYFLNNKNNLIKISKANTKIEIIIFKININISYLQIKLKKNLDSNTKKVLNNLLNSLK